MEDLLVELYKEEELTKVERVNSTFSAWAVLFGLVIFGCHVTTLLVAVFHLIL